MKTNVIQWRGKRGAAPPRLCTGKRDTCPGRGFCFTERKDNMNKRQKRALIRILGAAGLFLIAMLASRLVGEAYAWACPLVFAAPYLFIGYDVLMGAARNIVKGRLFDEQFLMTVATLGAFAIGEYPEGVFVMLFYQVGELFQSVSVSRTRRAIAALSEICPDTVRLVTEAGEEETDAEDVAVGSLIRVLPGDRVPIDGRVVTGHTALDLSALTGEALPVEVGEGDRVESGAVVLDGALLLETLCPFSESTASRILAMVEEATDRKARVERFITRFSRFYTPTVCILAVFAAFLPLLWGAELPESVYGALSFLVISCPCALVISVPLTFFCAIGGAAKGGVLFKGASELEALAGVTGVAFDKTGTLTEGRLCPSRVMPYETEERAFLSYLLGAERESEHPVACALRRAYPEAAASSVVTEAKTVAGKGVSAVVDGALILAGRASFLEEAGVSLPVIEAPDGMGVYAAREGRYIGAVFFDDTVKKESAAAVARLKHLGLSPIVMLSGDRPESAMRVAEGCGIGEVRASLLPEEKPAALSSLAAAGGRMAFVGDGINDSPALAVAAAGIAMGLGGTDAAVEAADVVLLDDSPMGVPVAIAHARRARRIVWQNIVFSLGVKAAVMVLSFLSLTGMWAAVFADVGVSVVAILNATRAFRMKR